MTGKILEDPRLRDALGVFADRAHAGRVLARMLEPEVEPATLLLAIPSGGVPVAAEIARRLGLALDVLVSSKITPPWNTEVGCGAVAADGTVIVDEGAAAALGLDEELLRGAIARARDRVRRRVALLRGDRPLPEVGGRPVVLVDDGLATGVTMQAAIQVVRAQNAARILVAVPTGHDTSVRAIARQVDLVVCPNVRSGPSFAVAMAYRDWYDVPEIEVRAILEALGGKGAGARVEEPQEEDRT